MKNQNFNELCKVIIETNGNPSTKQVENCGYSFETFLRLCNCNKEKLIEKAKEILSK